MSQTICQSCGMPMTKESDFGTDKDGHRNDQYCHYCFQAGEFSNPHLTLEEQIEKLARMAMSMEAISETEAYNRARKTLPNLKRWQNQPRKASPRQRKEIFIILAIALLIGIAVPLIIKSKLKGTGIETDDNSSWSMFSMIPIWVAVFVPIMVKKNKLKTDPNDKDQLQTKKLISLIITGLIVLIAGIVFFLFNES